MLPTRSYFCSLLCETRPRRHRLQVKNKVVLAFQKLSRFFYGAGSQNHFKNPNEKCMTMILSSFDRSAGRFQVVLFCKPSRPPTDNQVTIQPCTNSVFLVSNSTLFSHVFLTGCFLVRLSRVIKARMGKTRSRRTC